MNEVQLKPYHSKNGPTGVTAYQNGPGYIFVRYVDGNEILYHANQFGQRTVADLQARADGQAGLTGALNRLRR
jgi:hypothetical protein